MIGEVEMWESEVAEFVKEGEEDDVIRRIVTESGEGMLISNTVLSPIHDEIGSGS